MKNKQRFFSVFSLIALMVTSCVDTPSTTDPSDSSTDSSDSTSGSTDTASDTSPTSTGSDTAAKQDRTLEDFTYTITDTSITVDPIEDGAYKIDSSVWGSDNVFSNLDFAHDYVVSVKQIETEQYNESNIITKTIKTMKGAKYNDLFLTLEATKDSITANQMEGAEYSLDNITFQDGNTFTGLEENTEYEVFARYKETATTKASRSVSKSIMTRDAKTIDLYLISGQSNALGTTPNNDGSGINSFLTSEYPEIHYYASGSPELNEKNTNPDNFRVWTHVKPGLGNTSEMFGPEMGMAEVLNTAYEGQVDREAAIIKCAWGGTSLYHYWLSETSAAAGLGSNLYLQSEVNGMKVARLYYKLISTVNEAIRHFQNLGYNVNIMGLAWMQGEADAQTRTMVDSYKTLLQNFIADVRNDLNVPNLPFFIGEIQTHFSGYDEEIRDIEREVCLEGTNVNFIPGGDLQMGYYDYWHFAPQGAYKLGKRFGGAMLNQRGQSIESYDAINLKGSLGSELNEEIYATVHYADGSYGPVLVKIDETYHFEQIGSQQLSASLACSGATQAISVNVAVGDEPQVDGLHDEATWTAEETNGMPAFQVSELDDSAPQMAVSASFKVSAGQDGLYFAVAIQDEQFYTRYVDGTVPDRHFDIMSGIELLFDGSGNLSGMSDSSLSVRLTTSNIVRAYRANTAKNAFDLTNNVYLYHRGEGTADLQHNVFIEGAVNTWNHPGNTAYLELFVPFTLIGSNDVNNIRFAMVARASHVLTNKIYTTPTPAPDETPLSIFSSVAIADFSRSDIATWNTLLSVLD